MTTHRGLRWDTRTNALVGRGLRRRGWVPRVLPLTGYGGPGWVRVLARVLLSPPGTPREALGDLRGWRHFLTPSAVGVEVTVRLGDTTHVVTTDYDGYVDVRLPSALPPGWQSAELTVGDRRPVAAPVRVVGPETRLGLLSDIDDTVIVTMLPRPLVAFRNAFLLRESARRPVPGMADLYREILAAAPDAFVVYLSTGAWNTADTLTGFLARHGYPSGPMLLTDWGPTPDAWFRSGQDHKRGQLVRLFEELPHLRWLLVGDDGQRDPSLYAEAARTHPGMVSAIAIRQLSTAEQVAGHGTTHAHDRTSRDELSRDVGGAVSVAGPDGATLARALRASGLLPG
jgi:phosphatidate phosphatase APP1